MSLHRGSPTPTGAVHGERFHELARISNVVVEDRQASSPEAVEYRQGQDEWVVVLEGAAVLEVDGAEVRLARGDWLLLPAATPHRVLITEAGTRWLAVHVYVRADSTGNPPV